MNAGVLFGGVWSRKERLSPPGRGTITIAALFPAGLYSRLKSHSNPGKVRGIPKGESVELPARPAFYCGRPKARSAFSLIREVYGDSGDAAADPPRLSLFPPAQYFMEQSRLVPLSARQAPVFNVALEPGCRDNRPIRRASKGGGHRPDAGSRHGGKRNPEARRRAAFRIHQIKLRSWPEAGGPPSAPLPPCARKGSGEI